ncbi:L,D-transpeptidase family protein [Rubrimonas cliftonensis]|uniref:L,D-peptidoglycan transpeptidase YkuD, ErfK/YbiS/YcfS/YnhG family n=1 Tax=Rubrimonas cliftonensis TaxID=89524 RepID=A0A1H3Z290_9RHOB|nr:L,D-transpeptidase family protein [Rubrimonas cliftonensis]SEA17845.1 L,D-peptidoglycan transpeptidase YkuD, ErfK/YbiS/YcfS/YnhG family [Rubrimonas cliftonensis]
MTLRARRDDFAVTRWGARFKGRRMPVRIGRGGVRTDKREGDGATPAGAWRLTTLFFRADRLPPPRRKGLAGRRSAPGAALRISGLQGLVRPVAIGARLGWSDDPACPRYNRAVRLPSAFSAERMRRGDRLYDLVAATDHNAAGVPGAGSAIFLHLLRGPGRSVGRPTAGCVALRRPDLLWLLARWRPWSRIVVAPAPRPR